MEVLHVGMTIQDSRERWVVSRTPAMNPAFALVEVFWIVSGRRDAALPLHWNPALSRFSGNASAYHGAYGYRLREHFGLDQLDRIFRVLGNRPDSRQAVLQIWDSTIDLPDEMGEPANPDVPCNILALPKVRDGKLEWMQILRSNDLFLGVPHNFVQFTCLQEMLAGWLGIVPGAYEHYSDSLHLYTRDLGAVEERGTPIAFPPNIDSFALDRHSWDQTLRIVIERLERMMEPSLNPRELRALASAGDVPSAYEHALRIAGADAARRRGWQDVMEGCVAGVSNPSLVAIWNRWEERVRSRRAGTSSAP